MKFDKTSFFIFSFIFIIDKTDKPFDTSQFVRKIFFSLIVVKHNYEVSIR